jgi:hypothetical protein
MGLIYCEFVNAGGCERHFGCMAEACWQCLSSTDAKRWRRSRTHTRTTNVRKGKLDENLSRQDNDCAGGQNA